MTDRENNNLIESVGYCQKSVKFESNFDAIEKEEKKKKLRQ